MRLVAAVFALVLAGCGSPQVSPEDKQASVIEKPVLEYIAPAGLDPVPLIESVGAPWSGDPVMDSFTDGLSRRTVIFPSGSIKVDRDEGGNLRMLILQSGADSQCGPPEPLMTAYSKLERQLELPVMPASQRTALLSALNEEGMHEEINGGLLVRAIGGCLNSLLIRPV